MITGVTVVQYREKKQDTGELVNVARRLLGVTKLRGVPLIINDRVDVALAVGADGVHLGQDDMGKAPEALNPFHALENAPIHLFLGQVPAFSLVPAE